jgi:trans-aconitate methyltransferase
VTGPGDGGDWDPAQYRRFEAERRQPFDDLLALCTPVPGGRVVDLVFANASFQWVSDHPALLAQIRRNIEPGGQLAFQVPANFAHVSHRLVREVVAEPPFAAHDLAPDRGASVLPPERYAEILLALGASELHVRLQIYCHLLPATAEVVEWVRGTLLTPTGPCSTRPPTGPSSTAIASGCCCHSATSGPSSTPSRGSSAGRGSRKLT